MDSYHIIEIVVIVVLLCIYYTIKNFKAHAKDIERFQKKVTNLLDEEGITWKKEDGEMYVIKNGIRLDTYLRESVGSNIARVYFACRISDEELKPINGWGQLVMSDQLNQQHLGLTTFVKDDKVQSFCYADIKTAKDFLAEFNSAYKQFSSIMHDYEELKPQVLRDFPEVNQKKENKKSIGFE